MYSVPTQVKQVVRRPRADSLGMLGPEFFAVGLTVFLGKGCRHEAGRPVV